MRTAIPALLALLLPLGLASQGQDPFGRDQADERLGGDQDDPLPLPPRVPDIGAGEGDDAGEAVEPRDVFGRARTGKNSSLARELVGCWRLIDVDFAELLDVERELNGYLLISKEFFALEVQASYQWLHEPIPDDYQSMIAEYRLTPGGRLQARSLVGSYLDEMGLNLRWERPGEERWIEATMPTPSMLELVFENGGRMTFARQRKSVLDATIFGNTDPEEGAERDPLGRIVPRDRREGADAGTIDEGDVDIFGRPVRRRELERPPTPEELLGGDEREDG